MGRLMWSEYLVMLLELPAVEELLGVVAQVQDDAGAALGACDLLDSKSPVPPLIQRTPSLAARPARRDSTVILSATMKPE
jgi:hypothetical protein